MFINIIGSTTTQ